MNVSITREIKRLQAGTHTQGACRNLMKAVLGKDKPQADRVIQTVIEQLEVAPTALAQVISLIANCEHAFYLFTSFMCAPHGAYEATYKRFMDEVTSPQNGPPVIDGLLHVATTQTSHKQINAIQSILIFSNRYRSMARLAAEAGALRKLAQVLERTTDAKTKRYAAGAIGSMVAESAVRAKQAFTEEVVRPLRNLLAPEQPAATQEAAAETFQKIVTNLPAFPEDEAILTPCLACLAELVARTSSTTAAKIAALRALLYLTGVAGSTNVSEALSGNISPGCIDVERAATSVLKAVKAAGATPSLVQLLQQTDSPQGMAGAGAVVGMLNAMALLYRDQAALIVECGGIDAAKRLMRSASGDVLRGGGAAALLQTLASTSATYASMIGAEALAAADDAGGAAREVCTNFFEQHVISSCVCAACGVSEGKLQQCSACKLVSYCSKECQKRHWKVHKPDCRVV